jgi:hypothetical protein
LIRSVFKGSGSALPARCMTNDELAERVDTSDEWIRERTGIGTRYVAGEGETTGTLATAAARAALADAGIARPYLPGDRDRGPGRARLQRRHCVRRRRSVLGLPLRAGDS